jgi:hypothetical protein
MSWAGERHHRMSAETAARLIEAWRALPADVRSPPATATELNRLEEELGPLPTDLRWFLSELGGGPVGSEWIDDASKLRETHAKFEAERNHWKLTNCFVIGWDGAGNPIAIDTYSGRVVTEDHNFGGVHALSPSFEEFLSRHLLDVG